MRFLMQAIEVLCIKCHRRFVVEQNLFGKWMVRVQYCVFCGTKLGFTAEEFSAEGYEESKS